MPDSLRNSTMSDTTAATQPLPTHAGHARARLPIVATGLVMLGLALAARPAPRASRPVPLAFPGLVRPVRVVTDRYGIPHLRAESSADLYVAWGYVTARDRLWQIACTRAAVDGQLWRWLGNSRLSADGGAQLFELRAHAERIWERSRRDPAVAEALERYADGVNAYLAQCRSGAQPWPEEFRTLRVRPAAWRPSDTIALVLGEGVLLDLDLPEVDEAAQIRAHRPGWVEERRRFETQWIYDTIPDSAAARLYHANDARSSAIPRLPVDAATAAVSHPSAISPERLAQARAALERWLPERARDPELGASNVFAVGPRRSASGCALLANDTHLSLASPGAFHAIHVSVPGIVDAVGFCVPGIPAIVSGRNPRCAWGITALSADVVDVYADTLSSDGRRVRLNGGWVALRQAPYDLRFRLLGIPLPAFGQKRRYTPHGPVVLYNRRHRLALSVRWAGLNDSVQVGALLGVERGQRADWIAERFRTLSTPCLNVVAVDRDGRLVYQTTGALPKRGFDAGRGPIPGDGRHEWAGLVHPDQLPAWQAPADGFVVNANNRPVGPDYPEPLPRYDWVQDRALRMASRLAGDRSVTLDDLRSVQNDVYSRGGERFLPRLLRCADSLAERWSPRARQAMDTLRAWDHMARRARVAPTLYRGWYGALQRRSRLDGLQGLTVAALDGVAPEALVAPGTNRLERPATAALAALDLALDSLTVLLGPDLARWTWGRAHRAVFRADLAGRPGDWGPAPIACDGDNSTPCVGGSRLPWSTAVTHGPVIRHLVDLAAADSSLGLLPPGNSGDHHSRHDRDLLERWAHHGYVPFYLSWERIEAAKESEITLIPR